jgi:hypothetical protein
MTYAQGGLIQASDYNTLVGSTASPNTTTNTINTVWGVGGGSTGYGQTPLNQVSATSTITATQWSSLINTLNSILTHQTGSGSGISAVTSGATINYLSTLTTKVAAAYSGVLSSAVAGSTVTGTNITAAWTAAISNPGSNPPNSPTARTALTRSFGLTATFASADQARYFFNAGGKLTYAISGSQNASTSARTNEIIAMLGFMGGIATFAGNTNGGRTGSGGTLGTNDTAKGYWSANPTMPTSNVTLVTMTTTNSSYSSDTGYIQYKTNGTQGTMYDNGTTVTFWTTLTTNSGTDYNGAFGFDDSFGVTVNQQINVIYPETTNLSNTWGAVTISTATS